MPNYQVVRCANDDCAKFQSQQEKKSGKWACVVCGLKQSLKRVYFQSTAPKECRSFVMECNMHSGVALESKKQALSATRDQISTDKQHSDTVVSNQISSVPLDTEKSKWSEYVDEEDANDTVTFGLGSSGAGSSCKDVDTGYNLTEVDPYNRVVIGVAPNKQRAGSAVAKKAKQVIRPKPITAKPQSVLSKGTKARYNPYEQPQLKITNRSDTSATSDSVMLSQALSVLAQKRVESKSSSIRPIDQNVTKSTAAATGAAGAPNVGMPAKKDQEKPAPSKWNEFDSDSDSDRNSSD